jgi:hypothetical protein
MLVPSSSFFRKHLVLPKSCGENLRDFEPERKASMDLKRVSLGGDKTAESTPEGALTTVLPLVAEILKKTGMDMGAKRGRGKNK